MKPFFTSSLAPILSICYSSFRKHSSIDLFLDFFTPSSSTSSSPPREIDFLCRKTLLSDYSPKLPITSTVTPTRFSRFPQTTLILQFPYYPNLPFDKSRKIRWHPYEPKMTPTLTLWGPSKSVFSQYKTKHYFLSEMIRL